jgi:Tol biopolymer transport system component
MKINTALIYTLLFVFVGTLILVYQSESAGWTAAGIPECVQIEERALKDVSGLLVLESRKDNQPSFVLDLATGERSELPNLTAYTTVGPSKDGELIYFDHVREAWVLRNLKTGIDSSLNQLGSATPVDWMDDGRLLVAGERLLVVDLVSGEAESAIPDSVFTRINKRINWSSQLNWDEYSPYRIVPSRNLDYLAYISNGEPGALLVVWDQHLSEQVAWLHWADVLSTPQWAPDGKSFVASAPPFVFYEGSLFKNVADDYPYVGGVELMQIGVDGSVRRLTTFTTRAKAIEHSYKWSPSGKRIAFGLELKTDTDELRRVAVLNVRSGNVTVFCFPPNAEELIGSPVWSPDETKLALTLRGDSLAPMVYLLDVRRGSAEKVGNDFEVVGWWEAGDG